MYVGLYVCGVVCMWGINQIDCKKTFHCTGIYRNYFSRHIQAVEHCCCSQIYFLFDMYSCDRNKTSKHGVEKYMVGYTFIIYALWYLLLF